MVRSLLLSALLLSATTASATPGVSTRQELRQDRKVLRDQRQDYRELKRLKRRWARAVALNRTERQTRLDAQLDRWMTEEIQENRQARHRARREFMAMGGDVATLQLQPRRYGEPPPPKPPRRAVDDLHDFQVERGHAEQTRDIVDGLRGMQPAFDGGYPNEGLILAKAHLITGLEIGAGRDIKRAKAELAEDRRR